MKLAEGYLMKEVAGSYVLIPVGQNVVDYQHVLHVNETGYFILQKLEQDVSYDELFAAMVQEYEAEGKEETQLKSDLDEFLGRLRDKKLLCE